MQIWVKSADPLLASLVFSCDLENGVKVPKSLSAFCHVHVLDSCEFGQNQLTQSEDNVHLSIFDLILAAFFSNVTLKIKSRSPKFYRLIIIFRS